MARRKPAGGAEPLVKGEDMTVSELPFIRNRGEEHWWKRLIAVSIGAVLVVAFALPAAAYTELGRWSYDGCSWRLIEDGFFDAMDCFEGTVVEDLNGECHYLTAEVKLGASYGVSGPVTSQYVASPYVIASGNALNKGTITTWEHEWVQTSGWIGG